MTRARSIGGATVHESVSVDESAAEKLYEIGTFADAVGVRDGDGVLDNVADLDSVLERDGVIEGLVPNVAVLDGVGSWLVV